MPKGDDIEGALVLGCYSDHDAGRVAMRNIRRNGIRRVAAITSLPGSDTVVEYNRRFPFRTAVIFTLTAVAAAYVAMSAARDTAGGLAVTGIVVVGALLVVWTAIRQLDRGIRSSVLDRYRRWVTDGETVVIAEMDVHEARTVLGLLREAEGAMPATFIIRPHREIPARVAEFQRRERLSGERLELHAAWLANRHASALCKRRLPQPLWNRLHDGQRVIDAITVDLAQAAQLEQSISISAEWLLDNAYVIQRQIADVRRNLSHQLYDVLPTLDVAQRYGEPRAYDLAAEIVAHTDADLTEPDVVGFLRAYQRSAPLAMGEIWALPLLLRLALLESLSYLATRIDEQQHEFEWADFWANRLLMAARRSPDRLLFILSELARVHPNPSAVFADRLISQLQGESLALGPVLSWLELRWGQAVREAIRQEEQRHAADQTTIANGIGSLGFLTRCDWRDIFEQVSLTEEALRTDAAGVYSQMDFGTRDRYRHAVEEIARRSRADEVEVARKAVEVSLLTEGGCAGHVGYCLIGAGRPSLEAAVGYRATVPQRIRLGVLRRPALGYLTGTAMATALAMALLLALVVAPDADWPIVGLVILLLASVSASELAVQFSNFVVAAALHPQPLPKLGFNDGVPDEWRTLVVVPTLLASNGSLERDLAHLERHCLADRDPNLRFALLADLVDAPEREMPGDAAMVEAAVTGIDRLNGRVPGNRFSLFCRTRRWSETERCWMGWERKRGKLEELNAWLLGESEISTDKLRPIAGDPAQLEGIRFVITLDADTELPYNAARRLIGTLAHPLNRPHLSADGRRVASGYTIIQPRVSSSLPSATATRFARAFADAIGVDPYTQAVPDLYQDLAGEGSYYGKGIYDLAVFHRVLGGRFPPATLLSHDLLEGAYVRVGMATDIELFDAFPGSYLAETQRRHRWLRGDWQIAAWCGFSVPAARGRERNPLGSLDRWKLLDNLRRSLLPVAGVALLVVAWLASPHIAAAAGLLVALTLLLPPALRLVFWVLVQRRHVLASGQAWREQGIVWLRAGLALVLLPHHALVALDAIGRTVVRSIITHRQLLEWQTFKAESGARRAGVSQLRLQLASVSVVSSGIAAVLFLTNPIVLVSAAPFLFLWLLSPVVVAWLGRGRGPRLEPSLATSDRHMLRQIARETWRYFDDFVGPETNWLPPDNYQESPRQQLAERTSPTNIGLWLLATLAAHDFGYLTPEQVLKRGEATLDTLDRIERCEGHLLNWYETRTLEPLLPRYVSTVDSGNLLASLWTLGQGYRELLSRPVIGPAALRGLADTLGLVRKHLWQESNAQAVPNGGDLGQLVADLSRLFADPPDQLGPIAERLRNALAPAREITRILRSGSAVASAHAGERTAAVYWAAQVELQVIAWLDVVDRYLGQVVVVDHDTRGSLDGAPETGVEQPRSSSTGVTGKLPPDDLGGRFERLIARVDDLADAMSLRFLYDPKRRLFPVGYNVEDRRFDSSYYDLLASEARLASLVAIAMGDVPAEHWFALGRLFGDSHGHRVLYSWSGTMFEYLMPLLLTRSYPQTVLHEALREAVEVQIDYGRRCGVPWGISESAFSGVDVNHIYQYQAFGVPGLGLKRGLADDLVVAPYASALALMVDRHAALANLKRLTHLGMRGDYGYYEAIDYSRERQPKDARGVIVQTYMVHHQGMTLLALDNVIHSGVLQRRFHADRRVQAAEPLLFERAPVAPVLVEGTERGDAPARMLAAGPGEFTVPIDSPIPATHLLGNGAYTVMVTSAGSGFSRWQGYDLTRWRADTTLDDWGSFCYLKDVDTGAVWSAGHQPTKKPASRYLARFSPDRVALERADFGISVTTEIGVAPGEAAEIRYLSLANHSNRQRRIEVTSYVELALASHSADLAHPAFGKLFIETEALLARQALLAWRKPRSERDPAIWAAHILSLPDTQGVAAAVGAETDRGRFLGRGRGLDNPLALEGELNGRFGSVLDPIFSLRCAVTLQPGKRVELAFVTAAGKSRDAVLALVEQYQNLHYAQKALQAAVDQGQAAARHLGVSGEDLRRFQQLAAHLLYPSAQLRASGRQIRRNRLGQAGLWAHGISGDLPILLVTIGDRRDTEVVREVLLAHAYWRLLGFLTDLVILNEEAGGYEQRLQGHLRQVIQCYAPHTPLDQPGGIFLRPAEPLAEDDLALIFAAARVVLVASRGPLVQQLGISSDVASLPPSLSGGRREIEEPSAQLPFLELPYFNGLGGFTPDGREYAVYLGPTTRTPAPWVNIFANPGFGALVSESGSGFVWAANSQANRLTPWSNDPVRDHCGEGIYIRDEQLGVFWTPTAAPVRELDAYRARHGQGYTVFEHRSHAIEQELVTFVPLDEAGGKPVRIQRLRLRNRSSRRRRLSVFSYADLVLGMNREDTQMHVVTSWEATSKAILARNPYHPDFATHVAFASASPVARSFTTDRTEFLGRNGSYANPAALHRQALSGQTGAGFDPCAALQVVVDIEPGEEAEVTLLLGQGRDTAEAQRLVERFGDHVRVEQALHETRSYWDHVLETIQVETPDLAVNFLLNRWLLYQTLSCRIWARSAFYQSGGAVGFRDQLQDSLAMVYAAPRITRQQILAAAARQFVEGDVQHWWHPQSGAGVRTRISDDLLWLPYATAQYVRVTGDVAILDEMVPFLDGHVLVEGEAEAYFVPSVGLEGHSLLDHCRRALSRGLTAGPHGLPLIGSGDWNDGFNRVGAEGRGESVWLGWFIADVLGGFAELLEGLGQSEEALECRMKAGNLVAAMEEHSWDGEWYRRAYFDDGTPLGSRDSAEARIDSLPQSWAVISAAGDTARATQALRSADDYLVRRDDGLVLLFTPPFDKSPLDPGYVKAYPPGVRENGGQYTHAALWLAMAFARRGDGDRAVEILGILNPVEHARTLEAAARYKVEPYIVAADVYSLEGHLGQGGWTWYTGAAAWMYRVWLEEVLGLKQRGKLLRLEPAIPSNWPSFTLRLRLPSARYEIRVENPEHVNRGVVWVEVDGHRRSGQEVTLEDDGGAHHVVVRLGSTGSIPCVDSAIEHRVQ